MNKELNENELKNISGTGDPIGGPNGPTTSAAPEGQQSNVHRVASGGIHVWHV